MQLFLEVLLVVLLLLVFVQDLKYRAIHIALPLFIGILAGYVFFQRDLDYRILIRSLLFLTLTFSALYLYLRIRRGPSFQFFENIGKGDLLYFLAVIPLFSTANYILYFISGMLFSILGFMVIQYVSKSNLIPLAGLLALYLVILKGVLYITGLDFFDTRLI